MPDMPQNVSRRQMIQVSAVAGAGLAATGLTPDAAQAAPIPTLEPGAVFLFQGDSITDAGRRKQNPKVNDHASMSNGYPFMIAAHFLANYPDLNLKFHNRGISGHKVPDLHNRWQRDTIDLKPDVLSILIGVNDIWHKLMGRYDGTVQDYEDGYMKLIERTRKALPTTRILVCEPFVLRCGAVNDKWFPEFDKRRAAAKRVAEHFELTFVPFQSMFDHASKFAEPKHWAGDGVHPTTHGHALMTSTWLQHFAGLG